MITSLQVIVYAKPPLKEPDMVVLYANVLNHFYTKSHEGHSRGLKLGIKIPKSQYGGAAGNGIWLLGNDEQSIQKNAAIRKLMTDMEIVYWKLKGKSGREPFASEVVDIYKNGFKEKARKTLFAFIPEYVEARKLEQNTADVYTLVFGPVFKDFLRIKDNRDDIYLDEIDTPLFYRFELYLSKTNTRHG